MILLTIQKQIIFTTKSIEFDDLLSILISRDVRSALIKIDIETSESYYVSNRIKNI